MLTSVISLNTLIESYTLIESCLLSWRQLSCRPPFGTRMLLLLQPEQLQLPQPVFIGRCPNLLVILAVLLWIHSNRPMFLCWGPQS